MRPFSMFDSVDQSAGLGTLRKNQSSEDLLREAQVCREPGLLLPICCQGLPTAALMWLAESSEKD